MPSYDEIYKLLEEDFAEPALSFLKKAEVPISMAAPLTPWGLAGGIGVGVMLGLTNDPVDEAAKSVGKDLASRANAGMPIDGDEAVKRLTQAKADAEEQQEMQQKQIRFDVERMRRVLSESAEAGTVPSFQIRKGDTSVKSFRDSDRLKAEPRQVKVSGRGSATIPIERDPGFVHLLDKIAQIEQTGGNASVFKDILIQQAGPLRVPDLYKKKLTEQALAIKDADDGTVEKKRASLLRNEYLKGNLASKKDLDELMMTLAPSEMPQSEATGQGGTIDDLLMNALGIAATTGTVALSRKFPGAAGKVKGLFKNPGIFKKVGRVGKGGAAVQAETKLAPIVKGTNRANDIPRLELKNPRAKRYQDKPEVRQSRVKNYLEDRQSRKKLATQRKQAQLAKTKSSKAEGIIYAEGPVKPRAKRRIIVERPNQELSQEDLIRKIIREALAEG